MEEKRINWKKEYIELQADLLSGIEVYYRKGKELYGSKDEVNKIHVAKCIAIELVLLGILTRHEVGLDKAELEEIHTRRNKIEGVLRGMSLQ